MRCRLAEIRKAQGWTQKWLAEQVGTSNRTISEIINEKREPTLRLAMRISKAVGIPVEVIWSED